MEKNNEVKGGSYLDMRVEAESDPLVILKGRRHSVIVLVKVIDVIIQQAKEA